jgi:hypothetical protein
MTSINRTARTAGWLYLLMVPLGILGLLYVPNTMIVTGDPGATAGNILAEEGLFRLSIVSALVVQLVNLAVVLTLYKLLRPVGERTARMMVIFLVLGMPIAMLNEVNNVAALLLAHQGEAAYPLMSLFLEMHEAGIQVAGIYWGLWLFPMGYLIYRSGYIPGIIGILLMIGCAGYLADAAIYFLLPELDLTVAQFTFVGELLLPLWLVIRGINIPAWQKWAPQPA